MKDTDISLKCVSRDTVSSLSANLSLSLAVTLLPTDLLREPKNGIETTSGY